MMPQQNKRKCRRQDDGIARRQHSTDYGCEYRAEQQRRSPVLRFSRSTKKLAAGMNSMNDR